MHMGSEIGNLICLRHLIISTAVKKLKFNYQFLQHLVVGTRVAPVFNIWIGQTFEFHIIKFGTQSSSNRIIWSRVPGH